MTTFGAILERGSRQFSGVRTKGKEGPLDPSTEKKTYTNIKDVYLLDTIKVVMGS